MRGKKKNGPARKKSLACKKNEIKKFAYKNTCFGFLASDKKEETNLKIRYFGDDKLHTL